MIKLVVDNESVDLVSAELKELFKEALLLTSDCYLRERFLRAGVTSTELPLPISPGGHPMETRPVELRIEAYFDTLDWSRRDDIALVYPMICQSLAKLEHHPSAIIERINAELEKVSLVFYGTKIETLV